MLLWGGPNATFSLDNSLGVLITLAGPSAWALYTILSKPYVSRRPPTQFAGIVTIIGALPAMPFLLYDHRIFGDVTRFTPTDWLATLVSTGLALVLAYTLWYRGLRVLQPTQVAIYIYLVPVFGVLGAWLLLGEPVTIFLLLGGMTILGGVVLTNSARQGSIDENPSQVVVSGMRTATGSMAGIELSDQPVVE